MDLPERYIVSKQPKEYLKQGLLHCGAFSVKAIASAYGKDKKKDPRACHISLMGRISGVMTPKGTKKALIKLGLFAEIGNAQKLNNEEKIKLLKEFLIEDNPVILRIGNGYLPNGAYNPFVARCIGHWITVWGYDDTEEVFFVYDSATPKKLIDSSIPTGNTKRTYKEMVRDWKGAITIWRWKYLYIRIRG